MRLSAVIRERKLMFEQTFVDGGKTKKPWTVMVAFIAQIVFLTFAVLIPMIWFDARWG